jgi:hypothetical protein
LLADPLINARVRNNLTTSYVKLLADDGRYAQALAVVREQRRALPNNANFVVMEAHLNVLSNNFDEARRILALLTESHYMLTPSLRDRADELSRQISAKQSQRTS